MRYLTVHKRSDVIMFHECFYFFTNVFTLFLMSIIIPLIISTTYTSNLLIKKKEKLLFIKTKKEL